MNGEKPESSVENLGNLDEAALKALADFRLALRRFLADSEAVTSSTGVTSQQYQAMLVIRTQPGGIIAIKDLAEQMLLAPNGAVQLVDRLAGGGLVERRGSPRDRRSVLVNLTDAGGALVRRLAAAHLPELRKRAPLLVESLRLLKDL